MKNFKLLRNWGCLALMLTASFALYAAPDEHGHDHEADEHAHAEAPADDHGHDHAAQEETGHAAESDAHDHGHDHDHPHDEATTPDDKHDHDDEKEGDGHGAHEDEVVLTSDTLRLAGIRLAPVGRIADTDPVVAPARALFDQESMAHVGTPIEGRVGKLHVRLGDAVRRGSPLIEIDSPLLGEMQSDYLQKRAMAEVARAQAEVARVALERGERLHAGKGISLGELQRREGEYKIAHGQQLSAESAALAAENKLHLYGVTQQQIERLRKTGEIFTRYTINAPIDGRVVEREATLGEVVGPNREYLLVLADTSRMWLIADVPLSALPRVAPGDEARVTLGALGGEHLVGRVTYIAPQLAPETRTAQARIEIANPDGRVQAGMFGQVEIVPADGGAKATRVVAIPEAAVQTVEGGPSVFVAVENEPNTFARRSIKPGPRRGAMLTVLSGLTEGERIVVEGSFILKAELGKEGAGHDHAH